MVQMATISKAEILAVVYLTVTLTKTAAHSSVKMKHGLKKKRYKTNLERNLISHVRTSQDTRVSAQAMADVMSLKTATVLTFVALTIDVVTPMCILAEVNRITMGRALIIIIAINRFPVIALNTASGMITVALASLKLGKLNLP
jgi:hypothetical protein